MRARPKCAFRWTSFSSTFERRVADPLPVRCNSDLPGGKAWPPACAPGEGAGRRHHAFADGRGVPRAQVVLAWSLAKRVISAPSVLTTTGGDAGPHHFSYSPSGINSTCSWRPVLSKQVQVMASKSDVRFRERHLLCFHFGFADVEQVIHGDAIQPRAEGTLPGKST